jgi:hypothetical protein
MIIPWNPLVNHKFNLEGDYGPSDGYTETLQFASGKKRITLKNSHVPRSYPSLNLLLDHTDLNENRRTEYEEFVRWYCDDLRYGTLPFYAPRIDFRPTFRTRTGERGIYQFIPESLSYEDMGGLRTVNFGLEEKGFLPETKYRFLAARTPSGVKILLANKNTRIIVQEDWHE